MVRSRCQVKDEPRVQPNRVYVIPPDRSMVIADGSLKLLPRRPSRGQHHPIDQFLESLAENQRHKSIAVILSGTGSDGTLGLDSIKAAGGITFAQDHSAAYEGMPRSAIQAGAVDFVLPPADIARQLGEISHHAYIAPEAQPFAAPLPGEVPQFTKIINLLQQAMGVDFTHYKLTTLNRRIARRMLLKKIASIREYVEMLRRDGAELDALYQDILIHVTSFFREPETFQILEGEYEWAVGGNTFIAQKGTTIFAPRGIPHTYRYLGKTPGRLMCVITPAGFEGCSEGIAALSEQQQQDTPRVLEIAKKFGLEFLPPPGA